MNFRNRENDRRRFVRIKKTGKIKFQKVNTDKLEDTNLKRAKEGLYKNISPHGIMFESTEEVKRGDVLKLYIYLKDWEDNFPLESSLLNLKGKPVKLIGNVIHCEKLGTGRYQVGVEFFDLDPEFSKVLMEIIKKELT